MLFNMLYVLKLFLVKKHKSEITNLYEVKPINKSKGLDNFKQELIHLNPDLFNNTESYFIQTWDTIRCSNNIIDYMQQLDNIALKFKNNKLCFLFISEMSDEQINKYVRDHNINFKKFKTLNNLGDFISSIYHQKSKKFKKASLQFMINKQGDIIYHKNSLFIEPLNDSILINELNKYN